jgi:protein ImuA
MPPSKAHTLSRLQQEILLLQGHKPAHSGAQDTGLGLVQKSFPEGRFPLGALHEFISTSAEESTASFGFICGIVSAIMKGAPSVWVAASRKIFPPGLKAFNIEPQHLLFIQTKKPKEALWVMEEALKTEGLSAVVGELSDLSFTESRRLQLAVESSQVTGFLVRQQPKNSTTACAARWKISSLPSQNENLPGLGYPRWQVDLLKVRNGKTGSWQMEWQQGKFHLLQKTGFIHREAERKVV